MSNFAIAYGMKKKMAKGGPVHSDDCPGCESCDEMYAEGGSVHEKLDYTELKKGDRKGQSRAGVHVREAKRQRSHGDSDSELRARRAEGRAKEEHRAVIHDLKNDKKDRANLSEGGEVDGNSGLVDEIMKQRMMSEGGQVANDVGEGEDADAMPNEFDDLVLRDDLESDYDGENAGDSLGNEQLEEDERDLVAQIMRSRRKQDKMPRPA